MCLFEIKLEYYVKNALFVCVTFVLENNITKNCSTELENDFQADGVLRFNLRESSLRLDHKPK